MDKRNMEDFAHSDSAENSWGAQDRIVHEGNGFSELERGWAIDSAGHGSLAPNRPRDSPLLPSPSQLSPLSSPPLPYNHRRISDISDFSRGIELKGKKPKHGRSVSVIEKGGVMYRLEPDDDVQVYGGGLRDKDKLDDSLFLYHSREYLEPATESDPLVNIRLVFTAHQLPRGADFARLVGPLRKEFTIDTYMIPHESVHVNDDDDVVLGLCGTLERICKGLRALLRSMVPREDGFMIWRLCLLIPVRTIGCLIGSSESTHDNTAHGNQVESSIPCLAKAMGCSYGPIPGARRECLFTIESCSVETIMGAVEYIGKSLIQTDDPNESCHGYYKGGQKTMIPRHVQLPWSLRHMAARMDQRVPAGYILRPEMHGCLRHMQHKRFHLQFLLTVGQALELAGDSGVMFRTFSIPTDVMVSISDQIMSPIDEGIPPGNEIASSKDDILSKDGAKDEETLQKNPKNREAPLKDEFESSKERIILPKDILPAPRIDILSPKDEIRVCDVGANTLVHVEQSAVETIDWLRGMGLGKSSIAIYIPERAATRFKSRARGNFHFTVSALYDVEKQVRSLTTRLEPDEKESILQIEGWDKTGIRHAVDIILDCIYSCDSNSSQS
ncbi:hypothetical protein BGX34_000062 [Mortierella sp. NVP85]|nr:hypothetical protein BGX34_000062 [Mortierella sp. NVP85]